MNWKDFYNKMAEYGAMKRCEDDCTYTPTPEENELLSANGHPLKGHFETHLGCVKLV